MSKEYKAKSFKSGNSVALRMPAALGVEPGREWVVREEGGKLVIELIPEEPKKIDLTGIAGSVPGIKRLPFEGRELDWGGKQLKSG